ncbi:MAG: glycosyltransferase involved in cell wall biosynthesis [Algoriphagus sp.]|jgi:glycosyltransferase involved in cell wall biosynthesis
MTSVSIITITYNAENVLERTLKSIIHQTSKDFEYLVIDGGSKDKTLKICEKYASHIDLLVSEKDAGLYDAMNKGLALAKGKYVWFMNAGDEIAEESTLKSIIEQSEKDTDLIYGDAYFVNEKGQIRGLRSVLTPHKLKQNITWNNMRFGMLVCHQSLLVAKALAPNFILNNLSADINWEIESFKKAKKTLFLEEPICKYLEGGVSNQQLYKSLSDRFKVLSSHFGLIPTLLNHSAILVRGIKKIITSGGKYW